MKNKLNFFMARSLFLLASILFYSFHPAFGTTITWMGGNTGSPQAWSNAANWNTGAVPGAGDDVIIPNTANNPVLDADAVINSLTISAVLTFDGLHSLTVNDKVTANNASADIKTGSGALAVGGALSGTGKLDLSGNGTLTLYGDMTISSFEAGLNGTSLVIFTGTSQNVGNPYRFNNVQIGTSTNKNASVIMGADMEVDHSLSGCGALYCASYTLKVAGDITVKYFYAGTGTVALDGYINSQSQDINGYSFYTLAVNNTKTYLMGNVTVTHVLNFISGNIALRSYRLTLSSGAAFNWNGSSADNPASGYVVTDGSGRLIMTTDPSGTIFPVGHSASEYNPLVLKPSAANPVCEVNVTDGVTDALNNSLSSHAVNLTWLVVPQSTVTDLQVTAQWTNGSNNDKNEELSFFDERYASISMRTTPTSPSPWATTSYTKSSSGTDPLTLNSGAISAPANTTLYLAVSDALSPLPVTLSKFDAWYQNGVVQLSWATSSEINNRYFAIERSADGASWQQIGSVDGYGSSPVTNNYNHTDDLKNTGQEKTVYYRLKQVDFNGLYVYSPVVAVHIPVIPLAVETYPNPVSENLTITWNNPEMANTEISVRNLNGTLVYAQRADGEGDMTARMNLDGLKPGPYVLQVVTNSQATSKVIYKK